MTAIVNFINNQHISWQGVSSTLIFPTTLYYVNIADVVYIHVSTDGNQRKFFTRVCITRCENKNRYMRCLYLACHRSHRAPKRRWLLSYPLQKIQLPSLATFFINGYLKNERLLVNSDSIIGIAMSNMVGNDIQTHWMRAICWENQQYEKRACHRFSLAA